QRHLPADEPAELLPRCRVQPGTHGVELLGGDLALEPETFGGGTGPSAGGFADASVVLVDAVGDGVKVVALAVQLDLAETQHRRSFGLDDLAVTQIAVSGRDAPAGQRPGHPDASS